MKRLAIMSGSASLALAVALSVSSVGQAQDAANGRQIFDANCAVCHTTEDGDRNKSGPNLFGVFGAKAGQREVAAAVVSDALKASGVTWDEDSLNSWLSQLPSQFVPGARMGFPGLADDGERADVIALLKSLN